MGCCHDESDGVYGLVRDVFCASAIACALLASHRMARGLLLNAQVKALGRFDEAYTPEEREQLIHRIKVDSLRF